MGTQRRDIFPPWRKEWVRGEETLQGLQILTKGLSFQNGIGKGKLRGGAVLYFSNTQKC